jgi:hypothetical protein
VPNGSGTEHKEDDLPHFQQHKGTRKIDLQNYMMHKKKARSISDRPVDDLLHQIDTPRLYPAYIQCFIHMSSNLREMCDKKFQLHALNLRVAANEIYELSVTI